MGCTFSIPFFSEHLAFQSGNCGAGFSHSGIQPSQRIALEMPQLQARTLHPRTLGFHYVHWSWYDSQILQPLLHPGLAPDSAGKTEDTVN